MSTTTQTVLPPFDAPYDCIDEQGNVTAHVDVAEKPAPKPARASFTRQHTATADKQARAICTSLAKAGHADEANYLLHHWFPRKSNELIARAYEASKIKGSHIVIEMLTYERQQLTKFGNWDSLPRKVRQALS